MEDASYASYLLDKLVLTLELVTFEFDLKITPVLWSKKSTES